MIISWCLAIVLSQNIPQSTDSNATIQADGDPQSVVRVYRRPLRPDKLEQLKRMLQFVNDNEAEDIDTQFEETIRDFSIDGAWATAVVARLRSEAKGVRALPELSQRRFRHSCMLQQIGRSLIVLGRWDEAEPLLADSMYIHKQTVGERSLLYLNVAGQYAVCLAERERTKSNRAVVLMDKVSNSVAELVGAENPICAIYLCALGLVLDSTGDMHRSQQAFSRARSLLERAGEIHNDVYAWTLFGLGSIARREGHVELSESLLLTALETLAGDDVDNPQLVANCSYELALIHDDRQEFVTAERLINFACDLLDRTVHPYHPNLAKVFEDHARVARRAGKDTVEPLLTRAQEIRMFLEHRKEKPLDME